MPQFFDDVAFYFVVCSMIFVILGPWTFYKLYCFISPDEATEYHDPGNPLCMCQACATNLKTVRPKKKGLQRHVTVSNGIFLFLWIVLFFLVVQMPAMGKEELASFEPFTILGLEKDADDSTIKKAYRKQSMIWHPDKNPDNPEAAQKFMMIAKAYNTLTDETAKENMEKFGNPDGYKGMSMTIGLPSFLTDKENELPILLLYFLILVVIPPIGVWWWWKHAQFKHETGVLRRTIERQLGLIMFNTPPKQLIEVLAASQEYEALGTTPYVQKELKTLENAVKDHTAKFKLKVQRPWIIKSISLLYAHLLRFDIPKSLEDDYIAVLKDVPRIMATMLDMVIQRSTQQPQFLQASFNVITLTQFITQKLFFTASPLEQLPVLTGKHLEFLAKRKVDKMDQFKQLSQEEKEETCKNVSKEDWIRINAAAARLPTVDLECSAVVVGEEGIYEGDIVTVTCNMARLSPEEAKAGKRNRDLVTSEDTKQAEEEEEKTPEEMDAHVETLLKVPEVKKNAQASFAFAPLYPFPKAERWFMYLVSGEGRFLSFTKITDFKTEKMVTFGMQSPPAGTHTFRLILKCDSYVGLDKEVTFSITVAKKSELEAKNSKKGHNLVAEESDEEDDRNPMDDYSPFWDYLVMVLLAIFAYNWLQSKGYWAIYCTPVINKFMKLVQPITDVVYPIAKPVVDPLWDYLMVAYDYLVKAMTREL